MQHAQPTHRISTQAVAPRERAAFWREVVCRTFVELDCSPLGPAPLEGCIEDICEGERHLCHVQATAQHVVRGREQIARSRAAYVVVCFQRSGTCVVAQDGRETRLEPGGLAAVDSARPYALHFSGPFSQQVLRIPQLALSERIGRSERYTAIAVPGGDELARLLGGFLDGLAPALCAAAAPLRERLLGNAVDLTAAALAGRVGAAGGLSQHRLALLCRRASTARSDWATPGYRRPTSPAGSASRRVTCSSFSPPKAVRSWNGSGGGACSAAGSSSRTRPSRRAR
jgi:hypothetical protein